MKRRLRRLIVGSGRRVRPAGWTVGAVLLVVASLAAAAFAGHRWATAVESPARTLAAAGVLLERPLRLDAARDLAWRHALLEARVVPDAWRKLLTPPLPPALCAGTDAPIGADTEQASSPSQDGAASNAGSRGGRDGRRAGAAAASLASLGASSNLTDLDDAIRGLDQAVARGAEGAELEARLAALRATGPYPARSREEFLVRYNLARAYQAAGDGATAAQLIEPVFEGHLNTDRLPVSNSAAAARLIAEGRVGTTTAVEAFHARFLAGAVAYGRSEMATAIKHFRLGINTVNYLVAAESGPAAPAHYQRVPVSAGGACGAGRPATLTSLDAYAGLVAAYMAASSFRDPTRLGPELSRTRLEIDPGDPFQPVLRYARLPSRERTEIPENLIWAASNLQRIYHYNRLDPDTRLEVTRAALLLRLTNTPDWSTALARGGDADVCAMLGAVAEQLVATSAARPVTGMAASAVDSARAAAALLTFSRLADACSAPAVPAEVKSAWLMEGGAGLRGPLAARYERRRAELESVVRGAGDERVLEARIADVLGGAGLDERHFTGGRVPADLPATLSPSHGASFAREWRRAVFEDVAAELAAMASPGTSGQTASAGRAVPLPAQMIPAGRADQYLAALNAAIVHAGRHPSEYYAAADLAPLARANGLGGYLAYRVQYAARNDPGAAAVILGAGFLLLGGLAVALHVAFWRYRLLTRSRFYAAEAAQRASWPA